MQHKCKVTVIDKKVYPELQARYCANPNSGPCPCYEVGDEYIFARYRDEDDFWHLGIDTIQRDESADGIAGTEKLPHCSEAWDAISRYIYTALQGGAIMRNWMNDNRIMIACCSDGTRPVIFKIERLDYKAVYIDGIVGDHCLKKISSALKALSEVKDVIFRSELGFAEVYLERDLADEILRAAIEGCGEYTVRKID